MCVEPGSSVVRLRCRPSRALDCLSGESVCSAPVLPVYVDRERRGGEVTNALSVCSRPCKRERGLRKRERGGLGCLGDN